MAGRFELEGGVLDIEVAPQVRLELVEQLGGVGVGEARVVNDHVRGQSRKVGCDGPDVQVVDVVNVRVLQHVATDLVEIDSFGRRLKEHPSAVA